MEYLNGNVIIQFDGIQGIDQGCPVPDSHLLWNRREGYHYSLYGVRYRVQHGWASDFCLVVAGYTCQCYETTQQLRFSDMSTKVIMQWTDR